MLDHIDKVFAAPAASLRSDVEIYQMWEVFKAVNARVKAGGKVVGIAFLIELSFLNGRSKLPGENVYSVLTY